jgi:hypothetical protein
MVCLRTEVRSNFNNVRISISGMYFRTSCIKMRLPIVRVLNL